MQQVFKVTFSDGCWLKIGAVDVFACAEYASEQYGDWARIESLPADDAAVSAASRVKPYTEAYNGALWSYEAQNLADYLPHRHFSNAEYPDWNMNACRAIAARLISGDY
jgi:hypothetical protein